MSDKQVTFKCNQMQYYNDNISNKLITILCCIPSLLIKRYTCTSLRVCPNHARNTFTTFLEYYTDMINFLRCVHLYVHHLFYELSTKVFPEKKTLTNEVFAKNFAWQIHCFTNYCVTCDTILLLLTTTMIVIKQQK